MFLSPQIKGVRDRAFGRSSGHEGGTLLVEISALIQEAPEAYLAPFTTQGHSEKRPSADQEASSPDTANVSALASYLPASSTVKNALLLSGSPVCCIHLSSLRHGPFLKASHTYSELFLLLLTVLCMLPPPVGQTKRTPSGHQ